MLLVTGASAHLGVGAESCFDAPPALRDSDVAPGFELCDIAELRWGAWRFVVYAASLSALDADPAAAQAAGAALHAALLVEPANYSQALARYRRQAASSGEWNVETSLANHGVAKERWGHLANFMSCRSVRLPHARVLGCGLGPAAARSVLSRSAHASHSAAGELVQCAIPPGWLSLQEEDGGLGGSCGSDGRRRPPLLHAALHLRTDGGRVGGAGSAVGAPAAVVVPFALCRTRGASTQGRRPVHRPPARVAVAAEPTTRLTACTQPLYGYRRLRQEHRYFLEDWLDYHHDLLGLEFQLYDVGKSFGAGLGPRHRRFVRYVSSWPRALGPALATMSLKFPLCTEGFAYVHCLAVQRSRGHGVVLLHTPDTYLRAATPQPLADLIHEIAASVGGWRCVEHISIMSKNFARSLLGRAGLNPSRSSQCFWMRGSVLSTSASSFVAPEWGYRGVPLLNPAHCVASSAHDCHPSPRPSDNGMRCSACKRGRIGMHGACVLVADAATELMAHHYAEMWSWDIGRCERMKHVVHSETLRMLAADAWHCKHRDSGLMWAVERLRRENDSGSIAC